MNNFTATAEGAALPAPKKPILSPDTLELEPLERLAALRDWLRRGELPEGGTWDYSEWHNSGEDYDCGMTACAGGWYEMLTELGSYALADDIGDTRVAPWKVYGPEHFGLHKTEYDSVFYAAGLPNRKSMADTTRAEVADAIDRVLQNH